MFFFFCLLLVCLCFFFFFFFSSRRRHTRFDCDWSSDVCSSDLLDKAARDLRLAFRQDNGRLPARDLESNRDFHSAVGAVMSALDGLAGELKGQIGRASCRERV